MTTLKANVVERLLLSKSLVGQIRFHPAAETDRTTLAKQILAAHDAAELGIAAIADQKDRLPSGEKSFLMDYFKSLKELHPGKDVDGKEYFKQLNLVRNGIKHQGVWPDYRQWARVGENVYSYISIWCSCYLGMSLDDLDEAKLIASKAVRKHFDEAKDSLSSGDYKLCLESLAKALHLLLEENSALRGISAGQSRAEDAIKLAAFGVHANDYLGLQEFLPKVSSSSDREMSIKWEQSRYGHPGNWRENAASFCMAAFLDVAIKVQHARWIPGPIQFELVYEYKITALKDGVELLTESSGRSPRSSFFVQTQRQREKRVVKTLKKGESLRGSLIRREPTYAWPPIMEDECQDSIAFFIGRQPPLVGYINLKDVSIFCIPQDNDFIREYFPELPEMPYEPE